MNLLTQLSMAFGGGATSSPTPPVTPNIYGGNRSEVPYTFSTFTTSTNNNRMQSIHYITPANAQLANPIVSFSNWYANANGGESSTNLNPFILTAALEYPLGTRYQLLFPSSATSYTMSKGADVEASLASPLTIPAATDYWIRVKTLILNPDGTVYSGSSFNFLLNQLVASGRNEGNMSSATPTDDFTVTGTINAVASTGQVYGPTMVRGAMA